MEHIYYIQHLIIHVILIFLQISKVLFSHWDLEANYNEGGFVFKNEDII